MDAAIGGLFGLLMGSFLNVVIYRLPKMLERQWAAECAELQGKEPAQEAPFNLLVPRSHCQKCGHQIRWYENIPVLSYLRWAASALHARPPSACAIRWWKLRPARCSRGARGAGACHSPGWPGAASRRRCWR
jgi:prepilin signal peptidase PulO-like enzyme (type II secretory pathway)